MEIDDHMDSNPETGEEDMEVDKDDHNLTTKL
jgi:hypothetical protein